MQGAAVVLIVLADRQGVTPYGLGMRSTAWRLTSFVLVFKRKVSRAVTRARQPAGEEVDPQVWIPFPFKAALTVHFYLISPGRKRKFPVGSGCEGKTIWSWFALGYAPLPSNPRWWLEGKQLGISRLTKAYIKHQRGESPNHFWFAFGMQARTDGRGYLSDKNWTLRCAGTGERLKGRSAFCSSLPYWRWHCHHTNTENSLSVAASIKNPASLASTSKEKMEGCWPNVPVFQRSLERRGKYSIRDEQPLIR